MTFSICMSEMFLEIVLICTRYQVYMVYLYLNDVIKRKCCDNIMLLNAIYDHVMLPVPRRQSGTTLLYFTKIRYKNTNKYLLCVPSYDFILPVPGNGNGVPVFVVKLSPHQWSYLCQHRFRCPRKW